VEAMQQSHSNERYLPKVSFPVSLEVIKSLEQAVSQAKHVLISVPSAAFADMLYLMKPFLPSGVPVSWATKGFTPETGRFLYDTAADILGDEHPLAIISGPSFAMEAKAMHRPTLRVYTTTDIQGVQVGGAVKNILAIGAGISDGLGYGANARAALITRGMSETLRLALSLGAETETMIGLSGIGDLILTCTDDQSRNRQLGLAIGRGMTVEQAVIEVGKTVEGVHAAREVLIRAKQAGIEMPIVEQVYKVLFENAVPRQAVQALLCREQKAEIEH
jgi:glycerol-3-phosphate dehydrogenase (NAD(P)+)